MGNTRATVVGCSEEGFQYGHLCDTAGFKVVSPLVGVWVVLHDGQTQTTRHKVGESLDVGVCSCFS